MEIQTIINAKLEKAESFLQQIPEDIRTLFQFSVTESTYSDSDFVAFSFRTTEKNYIGMDASRIKQLSVHQVNGRSMVCIETAGSSITLYSSGYSHITVF